MNKSEKCYYAIIENKKRGKFSGASPIQVAKKVASNKLKSGKEIEFYLDEVGGKKKRLGPYQARKDKKTGQVVVVNGGKVMKGGVLSENDKSTLRNLFNNFNISTHVEIKDNELKQFLSFRLPLISFGREPIVVFNPVIIRSVRTMGKIHPINIYKYMLAVFKEGIGNVYIMIYGNNLTSDIVSMLDFFLNPKYSEHFVKLSKQNTLESLKNPINIESRTIRDEAGKIWELLYNNESKEKAIVYSPIYSQPLIRKCVYFDLTFGKLDEQTIQSDINNFPIPENNNQKYLILTNTGISRMSMNEPIIYVREQVIVQHQVRRIIPSIEKIRLLKLKKFDKQLNIFRQNKLSLNIPNITPNNKRALNDVIKLMDEIEAEKIRLIRQLDYEEREEQKQQEEQKKLQEIHFDYCIYTDPTDRKKLMIKSHLGIKSYDFNENLDNVNIKNICNILLGIPEIFGRFSRIREVSKSIQKRHNTARNLPFQLSSIINNISTKSNQKQLENQIKQLQEIIESLKLLEPKQPESQLNKAGRKLTTFPEFKSQLNNIKSIIQQLQPQLQPQPQNLEQQLTQLQKILGDKLIESQKVSHFINNRMPIQDFKLSNI